MAERTIIEFLDRVLPGQFEGDSWAGWRVILKALFGLALDAGELATFEELTDRSEAPQSQARELWAIVGRRGGKSLIAAVVAVFLTTCREYSLSPGEVGTFMVIAADRRQARVIRRYVSGLLASTPVLSQLVESETKTEIRLTNGLIIEIHTASFRSVRGYSIIGVAADEIAFWPVDSSAQPDREILNALRPAMATVPGSMLLCLSSPYARKGELWRAHKRHYGKSGDVLVVQAPTRALNPTVPQSEVDRALADDESSARAEWLAQFRSDIENFVPLEIVERATVPGRLELGPIHDVSYAGFLDFAGGSGADSATLAIAHVEDRDGQEVSILDLVREVRPPFSPAEVCSQFAAALKRYRLTDATADRFAADFATEAMGKHGITLEPSAKVKTAIYSELLPLLNSGRVELLEHERLQAQLVGLERRTSRGGRDVIDHASSGHDDLVNAAAGALTLAGREPERIAGTWGSSGLGPPARMENPGLSPERQSEIMRSRRAFAGQIITDLQVKNLLH